MLNLFLLNTTQLFQCHREERRRFLCFARNRLCDLIKWMSLRGEKRRGNLNLFLWGWRASFGRSQWQFIIRDCRPSLATTDCHALSGPAMTS